MRLVGKHIRITTGSCSGIAYFNRSAKVNFHSDRFSSSLRLVENCRPRKVRYLFENLGVLANNPPSCARSTT